MSKTALPLQHYLAALHQKYRTLDEGQVATYIPELAKANPDAFGISIVTVDGYRMRFLANYFRQCSLGVTCRDLAYRAATLANGGVHPVTGRRAAPADEVQAVLSIMATCGMYDYAGSWLFEVGLPAKSGVSGGVIAVLPGRFGIAIFSPPLDANSNSTRGIAVCRQMSRDFGLHAFGGSMSPSLVLSRVYSAREAPSRRVRGTAVATRLQLLAPQIKCLTLQGDVGFDGAEYVVRNLMQLAADADSFVLDMHRVTYLTDGGARLLHDVRRSLFEQGKALVYARIRGRAVVLHALRHTLPQGDNGFLSFEDNDLAVEWCEDRLLASHNVPLPRASTLGSFPLFAGIGAKALARLEPVMPSVVFPAGTTIIFAGPSEAH